MSLQVWSWVNGSAVDDVDERFDGHVVSSKPKHVKPGAIIMRNFPMQSCYRNASWEPDKSWSAYVDSVDGWLCPRDTCIIDGGGRSVWDLSKVDGHETARIMFKWLRENEWCHGVMLEMLARKPVMGWQESSASTQYFDEVCDIIQVRNRGNKWRVSLNGRHEAFVTHDDLCEFATYNKLEGALVWPDFPDFHDSHDIAGGQMIRSWDYWIERMAAFPSILEGFAEPDWGSKAVDQYTRLHAGLCAMFDAVCIRHIIEPGHWGRLNEWHPIYDSIKALGEPKIEPRRSSELWFRDFERGMLLVNPTRNPIRRLGVTVPAMDVVIQK